MHTYMGRDARAHPQTDPHSFFFFFSTLSFFVFFPSLGVIKILEMTLGMNIHPGIQRGMDVEKEEERGKQKGTIGETSNTRCPSRLEKYIKPTYYSIIIELLRDSRKCYIYYSFLFSTIGEHLCLGQVACGSRSSLRLWWRVHQLLAGLPMSDQLIDGDQIKTSPPVLGVTGSWTLD